MREYCCEELTTAIEVEEFASIDEKGLALGIPRDTCYSVCGLPYCPWCGTKLLEEKEDE